MNRIIWFLRGYLILEITGASPEWALNRLTEGRIPFWKTVWLDEFTLRIAILQKDLDAAQRQIEGAMCRSVCIQQHGIARTMGGVLRRPVLLSMLVLSLFAVLVLPKFVFFYEVTGNERVPSAEILRAMEGLGIGFGTYGPNIDPQWMKNHMLNLIPELQWITVTQNGCRAEVVVRERPAAPKTENRKALANVIATQSGIITKQYILAGQPLHKSGDTVMEGDLLVSGLVKLDEIYVVEHAQAEIYARTWRHKKTVTPVFYREKQYTEEPWTCVWLCIGEKRIKIFGNSGIFTADCDKMIETKKMLLPGGLELPVRLELEHFRPYEPTEARLTDTAAQLLLTSYTERVTQADMVAGEIVERADILTEDGRVYDLSSILECHEMIAASVEKDWTKEENAND